MSWATNSWFCTYSCVFRWFDDFRSLGHVVELVTSACIRHCDDCRPVFAFFECLLFVYVTLLHLYHHYPAACIQAVQTRNFEWIVAMFCRDIGPVLLCNLQRYCNKARCCTFLRLLLFYRLLRLLYRLDKTALYFVPKVIFMPTCFTMLHD